MNLLRSFKAARGVRQLASAGTPDEIAEARERLVAMGRVVIRPLLDSASKQSPTPAAMDVLVRLLTADTLGLYTDALRSQTFGVAQAAATALSRGPNYDPMLLLPLYADARIPKARIEGILAAQMDRMRPAALVRALPDLGKDTRGSVFRLLEQSVDSSVAEEATRLAGHADWWMRLHAAKLLSHAKGVGAEALVRLLNDENAAIRIEALKAIATRHDTHAVSAVCKKLRDTDVRVQSVAIDSLTSLADVSAVPHLLEYLKDEDEFVRRAAVEVLNRVVTTEAIKDLVSALRDSDWWVRVRAADALGTLGGPRVIDAVIGLVGDPDEFIRRYVIEILNVVPDPRAVDALIRALEDKDWWVRERAIDALANAADHRAVEPLLRVLATDPRAALLCVKALAKMPDERAVEPLCRLAASAAPEERSEAIMALRHFVGAGLPDASRRRVVEVLREAGAPATPIVGASHRAHAPEHSAPNPPTAAGNSEPAAASPAPPAPRTEPATPVASAPAPASGAVAPPSGSRFVLDVQNLEPGTLLGERYRVVRRIGGGGFGSVYLVEDVMVGEELVLKTLSPQLSLDEIMIRRFVQELRLSRRITHRNVIRLHDLLDFQGAHAISMEYFPARDLGSILRDEGPLAVPRVLAIASQVADGLAAAHDMGIVHRDIKPANILLDANGLVKIVDFGLAAVAQATHARLTQNGMLVGTPEYITPEQIRGGQVDGRTDLYSLGVVLYELITGRQPFGGDTAVNILFQHLEPKVPRLREVAPAVPTELDALVMGCMSLDPADRPADARALLERLPKAA
jgi:serine/threonine-protein kinase